MTNGPPKESFFIFGTQKFYLMEVSPLNYVNGIQCNQEFLLVKIVKFFNGDFPLYHMNGNTMHARVSCHFFITYLI